MCERLWSIYAELSSISEEYESKNGYKPSSCESFHKAMVNILDLVELIKEKED